MASVSGLFCVWSMFVCLRHAVANGGCADLWNSGAGPEVGVYMCDGYTNQGWSYDASSQTLQSHSSGNRCLASNGGGNGQFMIDQFGSGVITFYGPFVTDYCVSAC
jgi:hypothetical protein